MWSFCDHWKLRSRVNVRVGGGGKKMPKCVTHFGILNGFSAF